MQIRFRFNSYIAAGFSLVAPFALVMACTALHISRVTVRACFDRLDETTAQLAHNLTKLVEGDAEELCALAGILARHGLRVKAEIPSLLPSLHEGQTFDMTALRMPDGTFYTNAGIEPLRGLDFASEERRAPYLSGVVPMPGTASVKTVYQAVPVLQSDETIAVLYGYTELLTLSSRPLVMSTACSRREPCAPCAA